MRKFLVAAVSRLPRCHSPLATTGRSSFLTGEPRPCRLAGHTEGVTDTSPGSSQLTAPPDPSSQGRLDLDARLGDTRQVLQHSFNVIDLLPRGKLRDPVAFRVDDLLAQSRAFAADVHAWPCHESRDLSVRLRAEGARGEHRLLCRGSRHSYLLSCQFLTDSVSLDLTASVTG